MPNYKRNIEESANPSTKEFNSYTYVITDNKSGVPVKTEYQTFKEVEAEMLSEILKELRLMNDNLALLIQKPL